MFLYYFNITNFSKTPHSPPAAHALWTTDKRGYSKILYLPIYGLLQMPVDFHSAVYIYAVTVNIMIRFVVFFLSPSIFTYGHNGHLYDHAGFQTKKVLTVYYHGRCTVIEGFIVVRYYNIMVAVCGVDVGTILLD